LRYMIPFRPAVEYSPLRQAVEPQSAANLAKVKFLTVTREPISRATWACFRRAYHLAPLPASLQEALVTQAKTERTVDFSGPSGSWIAGREARYYDLLKHVDFLMPSGVGAEPSNDVESAALAFGA
jgi:hypothetical protein